MRKLELCRACPYLLLRFKEDSGEDAFMCRVLDPSWRSGEEFSEDILRTGGFSHLRKELPWRYCQRYSEQIGHIPKTRKLLAVCSGCEFLAKSISYDGLHPHLCRKYDDSMDWVYQPAFGKNQQELELQPVPHDCPRMMEQMVLGQRRHNECAT